jgi:hypothetical protein
MFDIELLVLVVPLLDLLVPLDSIMGVWGTDMLIRVVLYIMGLPLDLTQSVFCGDEADDRVQFKALFTEYGMVEHSILLSQLDSMGRRR